MPESLKADTRGKRGNVVNGHDEKFLSTGRSAKESVAIIPSWSPWYNEYGLVARL